MIRTLSARSPRGVRVTGRAFPALQLPSFQGFLASLNLREGVENNRRAPQLVTPWERIVSRKAAPHGIYPPQLDCRHSGPTFSQLQSFRESSRASCAEPQYQNGSSTTGECQSKPRVLLRCLPRWIRFDGIRAGVASHLTIERNALNRLTLSVCVQVLIEPLLLPLQHLHFLHPIFQTHT